MFRFVVNAVGAVLLALALVFAVSDIARSLAEDAVRMMPLGEALSSVGVSTAPAAGQDQSAIDFIALVSGWPASIALGGAAFLFLVLGRPRGRRQSRFAR